MIATRQHLRGMKRLTLSLDAACDETLLNLARRRGTSKAAILRDILQALATETADRKTKSRVG